jgi:hypothetical protein
MHRRKPEILGWRIISEGYAEMKVFAIVDQFGKPILERMFSTLERAERELLDDELGEEDGYFIREGDVPEKEYSKLLAAEAREDDEGDALLLGDES